jgi:hypothetical protein
VLGRDLLTQTARSTKAVTDRRIGLPAATGPGGRPGPRIAAFVGQAIQNPKNGTS